MMPGLAQVKSVHGASTHSQDRSKKAAMDHGNVMTPRDSCDGGWECTSGWNCGELDEDR